MKIYLEEGVCSACGEAAVSVVVERQLEKWIFWRGGFSVLLDVIEAAVDVIMEEIKILEKCWLKYQQLSDDQVMWTVVDGQWGI